MATTPPVEIWWGPEDDLLLKNAVEAGASLESLAKGAVQFSRRFTLRELQDRWYSLLYDHDISVQSSSHMFELEISGFNSSSKFIRTENISKGNKEVPYKRKLESIRKKYHAMRKKNRTGIFSNSDLVFFERNPHDNTMGHQTCVLGEEDLDILRHAFPETIRDVAVASGTTNGLDENVNSSLAIRGNNILEENIENRKSLLALENFSRNENPQISSFETMIFASEEPHLRHLRVQDISGPHLGETEDDVDSQENKSAVHPGEFADPDSLLNFSNEDEMLLMDVDEKHGENVISCTNNLNLDPTNSSIDEQENNVAKVEIEAMEVPETSSAPAPCGVEQINLHQEVNVPLKFSSNSDVSDGKILCTLNTEDTEIPCNDDIFLLIHPSTSFGSSATQPDTKASMDASVAHEKNYEQVLTKGKDNTKAFGGAHKVKFHGLPESHSANSEMPDTNKPIGDSSKGRLLYPIPKVSSNRLVEKDVPGVFLRIGDTPAIVTEMKQSTEASVADLSVSDHEESQIDADVPYFSDVEAMILEMDLDPYDQDSHINRQVPSYHCDSTKRTIIRLEQSSYSCLERAMTSQGALAILYGCNMRHYIKKPEVVLGRSTVDFDVDIDLRKEGRANKISRRQAMIKMVSDGSFSFKNLGKSSVSVNGMAVAAGQLMTLSSSCLIEIRGMSFVFEINERYVRRHLENLSNKMEEKTVKADPVA